MRRLFLLAALPALAAAALAQPPAGDAVERRFPPPAQHYDTPAFQPGRTEFTSNEELSALLEALANKPGVRRVAAGRSQRGLPIEALHLSGGPGRPVVLLIGQQHGDEPAGSEALLALAQQLAGGTLAPLLAQVDVVLLPRANPDGAADGRRHAADGRDPNRDHLLLRTPEARAIAALVREFDPVVVADLHEYAVHGGFEEKFGAAQRHDLLLQHATAANVPPAMALAADELFLRPLRRALDLQGLRHEWYHTPSPMPGDLRLSMGGPQPDTVRNVQGLAGRVGLLLESRGVGIGRQHFGRRVHALVVAATSLVESAAAHGAELQALRRIVALQVQDSACRGSAVVLAAPTPQPRSVTMLDLQTGADREVAVTWVSSLELRPLIVRERPCGYWLAADAVAAVERLRELGLGARRLEVPTPLDGEVYRETARGSVTGRTQQVLVATDRQRLDAPAGSWIVPLEQPLAALAIAALEPDSPAGYFANRLLPGLAAVARIVPASAPASAPARAPAQQ